MILFGIISGFVTAAVFGLAGMLPPKYVGAVMLGNGLSGILMSALRAIFLAALPSNEGNNEYIATLIYFIVAALILICAAFA
jgi:hypothetical protein